MPLSLGNLKYQCCVKFGKVDAAALQQAEYFLQHWYQSIWDRFLWRDTITYSSYTSTVGNGFLQTSGIELVTNVAYDGNPIPNISLDRLMVTSPNLLTDSGTPICYRNSGKNTARDCFIQLIPVPDAAKTVLVTGKKTFTNLTDDSVTPQIDGIDEALIALTQADLLEMQFQYGKAKVKRDEANAALATMIDLEQRQQQNLRQITPVVTNWTSDEVLFGVAIPTKGNIFEGF